MSAPRADADGFPHGDAYDEEPPPHPGPDGAPTVEPLPFITFAEIRPQLTSNAVIHGLLGSGAMSVLYGDSNTGKTFLALDAAVHVALGREWFGHRVRQGAVLYIAGEGAYGIQNRIAAFRQHHAITGDVPLAVIPAPVDLRSENAATARLIATVNAVAARYPLPVSLVVVDTLSRALAGGNENSPDDMGSYVMNVDRIRDATRAHVLSVHHTGKNAALGARGHSLLRAATDTEIEVARDEEASTSTARVTKQRDLAADDEPIAFRLERVELGRNEYGDPVSSCVVIEADAAPAKTASKPPKLTPAARTALDLLRKAIGEAGETPPASNHTPPNVRAVRIDLWRRWCYAGAVSETDNAEAKRKAFNRSAAALQAAGALGSWDGWVWLSP